MVPPSGPVSSGGTARLGGGTAQCSVSISLTLVVVPVRIGAALRGGGELVQRIKTSVLEKSFVR